MQYYANEILLKIITDIHVEPFSDRFYIIKKNDQDYGFRLRIEQFQKKTINRQHTVKEGR